MKKLYKKPEFRVVVFKSRTRLLMSSEPTKRFVIEDDEQDNEYAL